jgi:hypothetical protein
MRRATTTLAWTLWTFDIVVVITVFVVHRNEIHYGDVGGLLFILVFATTGSLVAARAPRNSAGWLMSLAAFSFTVGGVCDAVYRALDDGGPSALITLTAWVTTWVWIAGVGPAATFLLLLFPDGHLPSRRWRPLAWLSALSMGVLIFGLATNPGIIEDTTVSNPIGIPAPEAIELLVGVSLALLGVCIVLCCASLVVRYRNAEHEQRQQLKWLAWAIPVVMAFLVASALVPFASQSDPAVDLGNALSSVGLMTVPLAITCAILRSRLYDIDVVINRTLVYATLTATLAVVYLTSVLLLRLALEPLTGKSDLAVAVSTLAVAALFRPLRTRIQTVVDRRFYRRRYDAALTLQSFTGRLRQEVDLETVSSELSFVVRDTMHPTHVTLWLRREERLP